MPVVVDAIETPLLPVDLSRLQLVRYIEPQSSDAFRLARALASCPPAPPLPEPLPEPPDVPVSYLHRLQERVRAPSLSVDDQLALIARLETALENESESVVAMNLLQRLAERDDVYHVAAVRIARVVETHETSASQKRRSAASGSRDTRQREDRAEREAEKREAQEPRPAAKHRWKSSAIRAANYLHAPRAARKLTATGKSLLALGIVSALAGIGFYIVYGATGSQNDAWAGLGFVGLIVIPLVLSLVAFIGRRADKVRNRRTGP